MDLCACVSEYHRDVEGEVFQELSQVSYTRKYISLTTHSTRVLGDDVNDIYCFSVFFVFLSLGLCHTRTLKDITDLLELETRIFLRYPPKPCVLERIKRGSGIKDRDDKSSGIEILMTDGF